MKIKILQSAESEIADGMDYYNKQYPGLGYEFATEIKKSITAIKSYPKAWAKYHDDFRKCFVNRFPYAVLYELRKESIIIFAVMHLKMSPENWEKRLKNIQNPV